MRVRLIIDTDDPGGGRTLLDELSAAAGNGEGLTLRTAGGTFTVEALGVQPLGTAEGLVLNTVSVTDTDQAWDNLRDLACEELPHAAAALGGPGVATLRRVLAGIESVYLVGEQRFATSVEAAQVTGALSARLQRR